MWKTALEMWITSGWNVEDFEHQKAPSTPHTETVHNPVTNENYVTTVTVVIHR